MADKTVKVHVSNLKKSFGKLEVLKDISMDIHEGEVVVLLGPSGSGKSTFLRCLNQLEIATEGEIIVDGNNITDKHTDINKVRENIGMVFQHFNLFPHKTVLENIMLAPVELKKMTKEQAKEKAVAALKLVGLEQLADENPYDLELSERKLVAIASVLAMDTKVLILDEPTIAQDWKGRKIIQKMIRDLSSQGKTVIAILHDMDFVAESFERVIVMAHGKVLADGTKEEVFAQKDVLEQARIDQPYLTKLCQQLGYKNLYFSLKD